MNLQTIFEHAAVGIVALIPVTDAGNTVTDFVISAVNQAGIRFLPLAGAQAQEHSLRELFPEGSANADLFTLISECYTTGKSSHCERTYPALQQGAWIRLEMSPVPEGVILTFHDISRDHHSREKDRSAFEDVSAQATLLDTVLDSSVSGVVSCEAIRNSDGRITDFLLQTVNKSAAEMMSFHPDGVPGKTLLSAFPGNIQSGLFDLYVKTTETGLPGKTEVHYNYDNLDIYLDINTRRLNDGFVGTFTDISALKHATASVERTLAKLQNVLDTSQTGIFLFEPVLTDAGEVVDFRFVLTNKMLAAYVGQEPETLNGGLGSTWFPGYKTNGLFEAYLGAFLTGEQIRFDFHYNSDGIDVWLDIMATRLDDELLVTFSDYTSLKTLQQQLEASVDELKHSNAALEQFAYVASHDLQEPLRKIQTFGNVLKMKLGDNIAEDVRDLIGRMHASAGRMRVLIEDLLTYSRISAGNRPVEAIDMNRLLAEVINDLEQAIADKNAIISISELPTVHGDPLGFRQLFHNLLTNALKFTREGVKPEITITGKTVEGAKTGLQLPPSAMNASYHIFKISDNGIGFEPEHAERIFGMFQRLHGRSAYPGTGVGLSIVQKVTESHKGFFNAEGKPGQGATFRIAIPAGL